MKLPLLKKMNEAAWLLGIVFCALGVCLLTKAGFGLSMVSAAAYILHLKVVQFLPFFSQGMSEYVFQAVLLLVLCLAIQRFNWRYLLSFASAVIFGFVLDGWYLIFGSNAVYTVFWVRVLSFVLGELFTAIAIAFFFRTGWPLEIYELFCTELARRYGWNMNRVKQCYDIAMLTLSVLLALILNHNLQGLGAATVIITVVNAPLITLFGKLLDKLFAFEPLLPILTGALQICT